MDETLEFLREEGFCTSSLEGMDPISDKGMSLMSREELIAYIKALHRENSRLYDRIEDIKSFRADAESIAAEIASKYDMLRNAIRTASMI